MPDLHTDPFLRVSNIEKTFGPEAVLHDVSLTLAQQRTLAVLGRSGCGKTTLLKILAGLETADAGRVVVEGEDVTDAPAQSRGIVYLYQEPLLFPHLDVFENVAFGLRLRGVDKQSIKEQVDRMIGDLGLRGQERKRPNQLSGGQRQRVAFGRAVIVNPRLLLLDEPFASLDVETRALMQQLYTRIAEAYAITALFVTHDLKEALLMGDEIGHMRAGRLHVYPSRQAFINDPDSGVAQEVAFWERIKS
ncbi:MAG: ABC transporter ATP-binding protein [Bacteroidota bacterium]